MSTQQALHIVKNLPQLTNSGSQKPGKDSLTSFTVRETNNARNCKNWHEWRRPLTRGVLPEDNKTVPNRSKAMRGRTGIRRKTGNSDEKGHHKENNNNIFTIFESPRSQSNGDEVSSVSQIQLGQTHRHKKTEDLKKKNNKTANHQQQRRQQQQTPPYDFQLPDLPLVHEGEVERSSTDTKQKNTHTYENRHHHQQHLSLETSIESISGYHHLNECPFYTSEVSTLKLRILELEYINATLENKVRKYRDEIRLFKKDIKGYKIDEQQFAQLLRERENEVSVLHQKITQLLNQDSLPSPPSSIKSPVNISNGNGSGSGSGSIYNPYKAPSIPARSQNSASKVAGKYRGTLEHIEEAQSDLEEQSWI